MLCNLIQINFIEIENYAVFIFIYIFVNVFINLYNFNYFNIDINVILLSQERTV